MTTNKPKKNQTIGITHTSSLPVCHHRYYCYLVIFTQILKNKTKTKKTFTRESAKRKRQERTNNNLAIWTRINLSLYDNVLIIYNVYIGGENKPPK